MKKWSALSPSTDNPAPPQRALPFPLSIRGNAIWKSRASEPLPIHASGFGPLFPCNNREALLSPEEQPPHRNQNVSPILIKKRPDPFLLDQAVSSFFCTATNGSRSPALLSPLFPSTLRQVQQTKELLPYSLPASRKPQDRRGPGEETPSSKGASSPGFIAPPHFHTPPAQPLRGAGKRYTPDFPWAP